MGLQALYLARNPAAVYVKTNILIQKMLNELYVKTEIHVWATNFYLTITILRVCYDECLLKTSSDWDSHIKQVS